jgi:hypothetical protein
MARGCVKSNCSQSSSTFDPALSGVLPSDFAGRDAAGAWWNGRAIPARRWASTFALTIVLTSAAPPQVSATE